jgi:hypothetical protein
MNSIDRRAEMNVRVHPRGSGSCPRRWLARAGRDGDAPARAGRDDLAAVDDHDGVLTGAAPVPSISVAPTIAVTGSAATGGADAKRIEKSRRDAAFMLTLLSE